MRKCDLTRSLAGGFTLIELLFVLAFAGAALAWSVHTFQQFSEQRLLTQPLATFVKTLRFARATAIAGGRNVTVCPNNGDDTCGGGSYERGWIVFSDGGTTLGRRDPGERLLSANPPLNPRLTLRSNTFSSHITFGADGRIRTAGIGGNGRFVICADATRAVSVFVSRAGRLRQADTKDELRCL